MLPEQDEFIESLYRKYFKKLTIYAMSTLRNSDRAQDVVQDAFHEAVSHIEKLMGHENPGGWLRQTVKNKVLESERAHRRYVFRFLSLDSEISLELLPLTETIMEPIVSENSLPIEKIEQVLTPEEYKLLKMLVLDKASHLEVAQEMGISVYASQKRLERVREKLYKRFPERKPKKKK